MLNPQATVAICLAVALITLRIVLGRRLRGMRYKAGRPTPSVVTNHQFNPQRSVTFTGGAVSNGLSATAPLAKMIVDSQWVRIHGLGGALDTWIPSARISRVAAYRTTLSYAIRFENENSDYQSVIFWTHSPRPILQAFSEFGWGQDRDE
jgi:hypothetical protein